MPRSQSALRHDAETKLSRLLFGSTDLPSDSSQPFYKRPVMTDKEQTTGDCVERLFDALGNKYGPPWEVLYNYRIPRLYPQEEALLCAFTLSTTDITAVWIFTQDPCTCASRTTAAPSCTTGICPLREVNPKPAGRRCRLSPCDSTRFPIARIPADLRVCNGVPNAFFQSPAWQATYIRRCGTAQSASVLS